MTVASINPFQPLPPAVGTSYGNIMDAFFSTLSEAEKQAIWVNFLAANNLTDPVPPGSEQLFYTYINQLLASQQILVPVAKNDKLSPEEIKKRNIMFGVLNSVLSMLLSLQNTVTVEAGSIAVHGKWQKEYTDMLTRVPNYVGGEDSTNHAIDVNAANPDWSQFTIGYDGISVQDIAEWWAQKRIDGSGATFSLSSIQTMGLSQAQNGTTLIKNYWTLDFTPTSLQVNFQSVGTGANPFFNGPFTYAVYNIPTGANFDASVANVENAFKTYWNDLGLYFGTLQFQEQFFVQPYLNSLPSATTFSTTSTDLLEQAKLIQSQIFTQSTTVPTAANRANLFALLKPYTYSAPSSVTQATDPLRNLSDSNAKSRAEINSRDQQYIENIRSKRQVVQDIQSALQSNLDQSRQTLSQQTDLLNSIIDSLKGLLSSIFR